MKIEETKFTINDYLGPDFDCDCGKKHHTDLETVKIGDNVKVDIVEYLNQHAYKTVFIIEDENTHRVYGKELEAYLNDNKIASDHVILKGNVVPNEQAVFDVLVAMNRSYDLIIGVGSGTLNDLSKFISYKLDKHYMIVATAPSMDGFASVGAALITNDLKTTYTARVPQAIFGDLEVLRNAPMEMIVAGLGDILGKYTCLTDWKLANIINDEYYCETIVGMVREAMRQVVGNSDGIKSRDKKAIKAITEGLIITGIAMSFVGNSRPASGSEHHISHYWEMKFLFEHKEPVLHGIKVGVGTIAIIHLYETLLKEELDFKAIKQKVEAFDEKTWEKLMNEKYERASQGVIDLEKLAGKNNLDKYVKRIEIIENKWNEIKEMVSEALPPLQDVLRIMNKVNEPYKPQQIGLDGQLVKDSIVVAKEVRVRYGLLQLLWDLGLSEQYGEEVVNFFNKL